MTALSQDSLSLVKRSLKAFLTYWEENSNGTPPDQQEDPETGRRELRNTDTAMEMLYNYIEERRSFLGSKDFKLVAVEQPFAVPLDETRPELIYIGRFDKVFSYQGRYYIAEHKTTSSYKKDGPFRSDFVESFSPNSQIDGYLYAGHLTYGKALKACWIDAALVNANVHDGFRFLPVERHLAQLAGWLWTTHYWIAQIEANDKALEIYRETPGLEYLPAFPQDTGSCTTHFGLCPYLDLCKMWSNPEQHETPPGFNVHKWEPFNELELARAKLQAAGRKISKKDALYDNTRVSDSRRCLRYFYFRHRRDFEIESDRRALLFGGGWHRAMDVVWLELSGGIR